MIFERTRILYNPYSIYLRILIGFAPVLLRAAALRSVGEVLALQAQPQASVVSRLGLQGPRTVGASKSPEVRIYPKSYLESLRGIYIYIYDLDHS